MSNPNKIHYSRGYTSVGGIQFNPKVVVAAILGVFSLYAIYKYGASRFVVKVSCSSGLSAIFNHLALPLSIEHGLTNTINDVFS